MKIRHIEIKDRMTVLELIDEMGNSGVLGAGKLAKATYLLADSIEDEDTTIFLSVAGPIVPGGLRKVIVDLINDGFIDVLITSGANITHDLVESYGGSHYRGMHADDEKLQKQGMGRIGDIYTKSEDFESFETHITAILTEIARKKEIISIRELL
ncbi:MAG: deoxyhypusine synthase family protein, partial [Methanobacterium sp.]